MKSLNCLWFLHKPAMKLRCDSLAQLLPQKKFHFHFFCWIPLLPCRRPEAVGAPFNQPQPIHFFSIHELNKFKKAEGRSSWLSWFHYLLIPFVCLNEGLFVDVRSLPRSVAAAAAPNRASNSSSQPTLHPSNTPREVKPRQSNKINFIFLLLIHSLGAALPQRER